MKKLLSILMAGLLFTANTNPVFAENESPEPEGTETTVLELEEMDPSGLNVEKLGAVSEEEPPF